MTKLTQNFFARPSTEVAEDLLGRKMFVDLPGQGRLETILWNVGAYGGELFDGGRHIQDYRGNQETFCRT